MNLQYISLAVVLVATAISFFVATTVAPLILLTTSSLVLIYAYFMHRSQFNDEYKNSTWENSLRPMAPFALVGTVLFLGMGYYYFQMQPAAAATVAAVVGGRRR
jgi:hypothetical protein